MACYHPLIAQRRKHEKGVPHIIAKNNDYSDATEYFHLQKSSVFDTWQIPCGKCIGCRLDYAKEWANRCYLESTMKSPNWFVTLTYDDAHLPMNYLFTDEECLSVNSLKKDDLSGFIKRLRRHYDYHNIPNDLSFYACGEYGSNFFRPHYHILLFGIPINDLVYHSTKNGFITYNSPTFDSLWKRGFVTINEFSYETASYVARYMLKKQKGDASIQYSNLDIVPEFSQMSRNPGIAQSYYSTHKDEIFNNGYISVKTAKGVFHEKVPKYFMRLLEKDDPKEFFKIKKARQEQFYADLERNAIFKTSELTNCEQRLVDEFTKLSQIKALRRDFESSYNIV